MKKTRGGRPAFIAEGIGRENGARVQWKSDAPVLGI